VRADIGLPVRKQAGFCQFEAGECNFLHRCSRRLSASSYGGFQGDFVACGGDTAAEISWWQWFDVGQVRGLKMSRALMFVGPWAILDSLAENQKKKCAGMFHMKTTCVSSNLCQKLSEY
jgi:hypothetical protein